MAEPSETVPDELIERLAARAAKEVLRHASHLSEKQASDIALAAAKEAVHQNNAQLFALLGVNISNYKDINRLRDNLAFLNSLHDNTSKAGARIMMGAVTVIAGAIFTALWMGFRAMIGK